MLKARSREVDRTKLNNRLTAPAFGVLGGQIPMRILSAGLAARGANRTASRSGSPEVRPRFAGIKMVEAYRSQYGSDFISVMPTNLYGPGDNDHPEFSHVLAALIRRFHEAKVEGRASVVVWGTGTPRREFLYVEDTACI